ncbi:protein Spindly isoform X2 [Puntigrus tetrazona]|uniref:protein Spindly isoform X2 n=1 Tax=Puntigrus tetrazona TaxID=1606681 RepID=UPI001C8A68F6|nr:protein Spindly isoform X2 [Puntigrus tetrazona]
MSDLENEIKVLRRKVQEGEEALQRAGQYGLQLLDDKMDLHSQLEEQRIEMTGVIEALEQEKYSLQREVELKARMLESLRSEFDLVKNQQKHHMEQQQTLLERNHALELSDLKNKLEKMKTNLEEAQLAERQMRHKLDQQSEALNSKTEELRALTERAHETMSSEILELQMQMEDMESTMATLEQELQEARYKEEQLHLANTAFQRQLERLTEEKEEREKEAVSCYNALEKAREANQDLQIQLEQVLQQAQDPNSKGNSLFSEVEDKRAEMERQLNSMKRQHESLHKQHALTKQHMHRMKMQIATLMQLQGNRADPAQLERLQFMLSEKNNEIESLMIKVRELEKEKMTVKDQHPAAPSKEGELMDETYYTDLLKMQLSNSKKDAEKLKDELSMARMKALSESQRVLELERKLYGTEQALKQRHSDNMRLQVKLEELKMKYTPNEVNKAQVQKRRREKFPVPVPEEKSASSKEETATMDTEPSKGSGEKTVEETLNHPVEKPVVIPLQSAQATDPNPRELPRESKSVRICEDPPVCIPDAPRSPVSDSKSKNDDQTHQSSEEEENWRTEKKRKKYQQPTHVNSEKTMANECAQQ